MQTLWLCDHTFVTLHFLTSNDIQSAMFDLVSSTMLHTPLPSIKHTTTTSLLIACYE